MWQKLQDELAGQNFTVVTVAMDVPEAAQPWIEASGAMYPCLVDRYHHVADLYNMVNVPQAVWIDEAGKIARPPENAGSSDAFRQMDRATGQMTAEQTAERARLKSAYIEAVRNWVVKGATSPHVPDTATARSGVRLPDDDIALAHAHFRLAQLLVRQGKGDAAADHFAEASRLHPDSWNIWRQGAKKQDSGFASGPDFWARVDALGDRPYHRPIDFEGIARR